jgi:hypothetical protein
METDGTYVTIHDWMLKFDLDLTETVVYAIIHGFSMNGRCRYDGSRRYLAAHAKCSTDKVDKSLKKLRDLGLISKTEIFRDGVKFCEYTSTVGSRYEQGVAAGSGRGVAVTDDGGSRWERHNNIEDNKDNNIDASTRAHARVAARKKFDFKAALISAGISGEYADKLIAIRKSKRLTNSERAANDLNAAITTICNTQGLVPDEVVKFCIDHNWGAIRPDWEGVEHIKARTPRSRTVRSLQEIMQRDGTIF